MSLLFIVNQTSNLANILETDKSLEIIKENIKKKIINENKWFVSANDLSLYQCFLCQENQLNFFSFLKLGKLFEIGSEGEN